ncbi:hypothetical protein HDU76_010528 [Blyttiomyces sp. JEL0837]|nr:hypothetical protein HDU76_010528 [Blyttiomyces sp. JEL0837]
MTTLQAYRGILLQRNLLLTSTHSSLASSLFDIQSNPNSGRGWFATQNINAGQLLSKERPFLSVLKKERMERCPHCWRRTGEGKQCSELCGQEISARSKPFLKKPAFQQLRQRQLDNLDATSSAFPIMITDLIGLSLTDLSQTGGFQKSLALMNLLAQAKPMQESHVPEPWRESYNAIRDAILTEKGQPELFNVTWFASQMTRLNINAMTVQLSRDGSGREGDLLPMGSALYLLTSMLNHSCEPNAGVSWSIDGEDINKGDEITINYVDGLELTDEERFEHLRYNYGFHCGCPKCIPVMEARYGRPI